MAPPFNLAEQLINVAFAMKIDVKVWKLKIYNAPPWS